MATAPLAAEADEPLEGANDGAAPERDYEAEAREMGWQSPEEFKGDKSRAMDAKTFVERGEQFMPMLKKQNDALKQQLKTLKADVRRATDHFSRSEERAYERAKAEIEGRLEEAAGAGDAAGAKKAGQDLVDLQKSVAKAAPTGDIALEAKEALIDWREKNPWYDKPGLAHDYADTLVERHAAKTNDMAPAEFFEFIGSEVQKRFPNLVKADDEPAPRKHSAVEGVPQNRRAAGGGKGWADMDPEERRIGQAMASRWVKSGLLEKADDFLKTYDWSSKK